VNLDELPDAMTPAEVVEAYEEAWRQGHYQAFLWITTEHLWESLGVETREEFSEAARDYQEGSEGHSMVITGLEVDGSTATVTTTETSVDGTDHVVEQVSHLLVHDGEAWLVDGVTAV